MSITVDDTVVQPQLVARVVTALSALPGPPTAYVYHPFGVDCTVGECGLTLGTYTPLFGGRVHYSHAVRFASADELLRFLKRGVAQAMVAKPLNLLLMIFLNARGQVALCRDVLLNNAHPMFHGGTGVNRCEVCHSDTAKDTQGGMRGRCVRVRGD